MTGWLNPFHVLGMPISASRDQILARADDLARIAATDEDRNLIAWARHELTTDPVLRARYERTEPRATDYARQERWEAFVHDFTPNPITPSDTSGPHLGAEDVDLPSAAKILIHRAADAGLDSLDPLFQTIPTQDADGVSRLEIRDVLFG
ncbi:MAG TPA: hypothetical protein VL551_19710 [Actinospica sp.]|jgi:hypothetical protein|nr:hypothetical protein [Actinospica sp.]